MIVRTLLLSTLLAVAAFAADVTGKWTATVEGRNGQSREVVYNLKADGGKLTGTVSGMRGNEMEITDGTVDGDNVSFKTKMEFNGNSMVMNYKGKVSGDELKLTQMREGGDNSREVTAKRAK